MSYKEKQAKFYIVHKKEAYSFYLRQLMELTLWYKDELVSSTCLVPEVHFLLDHCHHSWGQSGFTFKDTPVPLAPDVPIQAVYINKDAMRCLSFFFSTPEELNPPLFHRSFSRRHLLFPGTCATRLLVRKHSATQDDLLILGLDRTTGTAHCMANSSVTTCRRSEPCVAPIAMQRIYACLQPLPSISPCYQTCNKSQQIAPCMPTSPYSYH